MTKTGANRGWRGAELIIFAAVALAAGAGWARAGLALSPSELVATLHQVNQMEISAGQLAQQNSSSAAVKDFGQVLVLDHQAADDQITTYASSKGMSLDDLPASVKKRQQEMQAKLDKLQDASGPSFDHQFALEMAAGHRRVIAMLDASRPTVTDEGLIVLLDRQEPKLRKHLQMAENILNPPKAGQVSTPPSLPQ